MDKPNTDEKKLKRRFFILAFALTFLILAILSAVSVFFLEKNKKQDADVLLSEENIPIETDLPAETLNADKENILFISMDKENHAYMLTLIGTDPKNKKINMSSFPANSVLPNRQSKTMGEILDEFGENYLCRSISELTQSEISKFVKMDYSQFSKLVFSLGGAEIDLPEAVSINDSDTGGVSVNLKEGKSYLDSVTLFAVMFYDSYSSINISSEVFSRSAAQLTKNMFSQFSQDKEDALFNLIVNSSFTNLNRVDYETGKKTIKFFSELSDSQIDFINVIAQEFTHRDEDTDMYEKNDSVSLSFSSLNKIHEIYGS